jgi:transposase-like protein
MTSMIAGEEVLKQDTRGRVRTPVERREALLDEFEQSGASGAQFARLAGIKYATFANWVQQRRQKRATLGTTTGSSLPALNVPVTREGPVRLFEALVEEGRGAVRPSTSAPRGLVIELPGGSRMIVESPVQMQMAAELVALIAQRALPRC